MKKIKILFKLLIIFLFLQNYSLAETSQEVDKISKNLRCLICQGQSVYESNSEFALSVKNLISEKLNSGESEDDIYNFLKSKYGDWIVYEPEFNKYTLVLWILPIFLFIFGGLLIARKVFINSRLK